MTSTSQLTLTLAHSELSRFTGPLQKGVALRAATGGSVYGFLVDELGLAPAYVEERITTVFLDGQVVDDLEKAALQSGSLLALSAAMPGLVGATLRRAGPYSVMRAEITRSGDPRPAPSAAAGIVRVKLFNLLIAELGPVLLEHGIVLERGEVREVLGEWCNGARELPGGGDLELRVRFA